MQLFVLGFLTLFQELVLIRYLAGNIWNLGFFPNLVLIGVFIGMGTGFVFHHSWDARRSNRLFQGAVVLLLALVAFVTFFHPVMPGFRGQSGSVGGELFFTRGGGRGESPLLFFLWFGATVAIFTLISQRTAKLFRRYAPLHAYTLDIAGSCCGILAFMAVSWLGLPAYVWFAVLIPLYLLAIERGAWRHRAFTVAVLAVTVGLAAEGDRRLLANPAFDGTLEVAWSPYQKVEFADSPQVYRHVFVNGISHQNIEHLNLIPETFYALPYRDRERERGLPPYQRVLIIGAGAGNDAYAALLNGVEHVDAVEIDPVILDIGKRHHPGNAYTDPRVTTINDDGRAVLTRSQQTYDLIIFALTDSLVKVSPMTQLRMENYLFTVEAARRAFSLLNDGGSVVYYNHYRRPWLVDKVQAMIFEGTGQAPRVLMSENNFAMLKVTKRPRVTDFVPAIEASAVPHDDWPFLYLRHRAIPPFYLGAMAFLAVLVGTLMFAVERLTRRQPDFRSGPEVLYTKLAFVLMGLAFLLLETKSVIQFSLLFGTTWLNNSLVFLGVLVLVLAANWTALLLRNRRVIGIVYVLLLASCLVTLAYPLANLLYFENPVLRFCLASLLTFSPIFFANLIFSITFRDQEVPEHLFGWNLIGATLGGMVEYTSMALGYNALAIVVAGAYTLVFLLLWAAQRLRTATLAATVAAPSEGTA